MSVGENIKRLRQEKNMTQLELSEQVGCTQSMIAQIERGSKVPSLPLGKSIADILKCTVDHLFADETA